VSIEEREGVLDQVSEKGILLSGSRLSYSKWFEGDRPTEDALGCQMRVIVDAGEKCTFLKRVLSIGGKSLGWKPPEPGKKGFFGGGGGRRFSPEELELKREEGIRIARSVAIDRATTMVREGIPIDKIAPIALAVESYLLTGKLRSDAKAPSAEARPEVAPERLPSPGPEKVVTTARPESPRIPGPATGTDPATPTKPKRLAAKVVSGLFNEALRGGLVEDWQDFLSYFESVLKVQVKNPYQLSASEFGRVEAVLRSKLGRNTAA
jgi:hypothetical protein